VHALVGRDENILRHALAELEQAELLFRRGNPPDAVYTFKHALVRDAAYESLLKSRRQQLHGQIARIIEERFADVVASQPEVVAHHYTDAGLIDPAINYWLKAGHLALSRSANAEAVRHLRQGIELTRSQAPSNHRRNELDFYLALGPAMAATEGYASPETLRVLSQTRDLLGEGGTPTEQMTVFWGVYLAHAMRGEHTDARDVAERCFALASRDDHPGMLALANRFMGQTLWMMGAFVEARRHLESTLALCAANPETVASYRRFGADDEVTASSALSRTLWVLGYPDQASSVARQALARARTLGLAFTTAFALDNEALLGILGADLQRATALANEAMTHSIEHSLADYEQRARFAQGALLAQSGKPERGIKLMHSAIATIERTNNRNRGTLYLGHSAAARASMGQAEVGLALLDEAIQTAETTDERFFEAELHRLRGEMLLMLGRASEAEAVLLRALAIARQQQARWWELRAATSLARHWRDKRQYADAHAVLQPVYSWFTEGFETTSLADAKTLLDELSELSGALAPRFRSS
jgi:predicted ATPase